MEKKENNNDITKRNLKIGIVLLVIIAIILTLVLMLINNKLNKDENINSIGNLTTKEMDEKTPILTTKKVFNYLEMLRNGYYMSCKTKVKNDNGEIEDAVVERAITKEKMFINYKDYLASQIVTPDGVYYVSHSDKTVIKYSSGDSSAKIDLSLFLQGYTEDFFNKNFISTGTEKIDDIDYYYEEYNDGTESGLKIRYYFDENDALKYIKNIASDGDVLTEILEFTDKVDESLFEIPKDYKIQDYAEYIKSMTENTGN